MGVLGGEMGIGEGKDGVGDGVGVGFPNIGSEYIHLKI